MMTGYGAALLHLVLVWAISGSAAFNITLQKSIDYPLEYGSTSFFTLFVSSPSNVTCDLQFGDNRCIHLYNEDCLNTTGSPPFFVLNYTYTSAGHFLVNATCDNTIQTASAEVGLFVEEPVTDIVANNSQITLQKNGSDVIGTATFTYTQGTDVMAICMIDDTVLFYVCGPTTTVDNSRKTVTVTFKDSYFSDFGYHALNITLFNYVSSNSTTVTLNFQEAITNLVIDAPEFVRINDTVTAHSRVDTGSYIDYMWSLGAHSGTSMWVTCVGNNTNSSFTPALYTLGNVNLDVVASNAINQISTSRSVTVLYPVEDFEANLTSSQPGADLVLTARSAYSDNMGNLTIEILDQTSSLKNSTGIGFNQGDTKIVYSGISQGDRFLTVRIHSPVSTSELSVYVSLWNPINVSLYTETTTLSTGSTFNVEVVNTTTWGHNYQVNFGDGTDAVYSDVGIIRSSNRLISHSYSAEGSYSMTVIVSNERYEQVLNIQLRVMHPFPEFTINGPSLIFSPPGALQVNVLFSDPASPKPNNATCWLCKEAQDSGNFDVCSMTKDNVTSGIINAEFPVSGSYNVSVACANDYNTVSSSLLVEVKEFSADNFTFSYPLAVGMNSWDSSVEVRFTAHLFDDDYIPPNVIFAWNFQDTPFAITETFQAWNKTKVYTERGTYNVTLTITVLDQPAKVFHLPVTIGVLSAQTSLTVGNIKSDPLLLFIIVDAKGTNVSYAIDFGDGDGAEACLETNVNSSFGFIKTKNVTNDGSYRPSVRVFNAMFDEEAILGEVLMLWPVEPLSLIVEDVKFPPGRGSVTITQAANNPPPTNVTCRISYSDGSTADTAHGLPVTIQHDYLGNGEIDVSVNCSNLVSSQIIVNTTTLIRDCFGLGLPFLDQGLITKMVSEQITLTATVNVLCTSLTSVFHWNITKDGEDLSVIQPHSTVLSIHPHHFQPGLYEVHFKASFVEYPTLSLSDSVSLQVLNSPLVVSVTGATSKTIGTQQSEVVDAASESSDPDVPAGQSQGLSFTWSCGRAPDLTSAERLVVSRELSPCPACLIDDGAGRITVEPGCLEVNKSHALFVEVSKGERIGNAYKILQVTLEPPPDLELRCTVNCLKRKNAEFSVTLEGVCLDCSNEVMGSAKYEWKLYRRLSLQDPQEEVSDLHLLTNTGVNISGISIAPRKLSQGFIYKLELHVTEVRDRSPGTVSETFSMNFQPRGGRCGISPEIGQAVLTRFVLRCDDWMDEGDKYLQSATDTGDSLKYQFLVINNSDTSLIYSGDSSISPPVELKLGDEQNGYQIEITARIFDPYNGMNEATFMVTVKPPVSKDSGINNISALSSVLDDVTEKLEQSVLQGDIQQTSKFIESASSVISTLELPVINTSLPADPSPWLGAQPLDVPQGNKSAVKFDELWTDLMKPEDTELQDKLTEQTDGYIDALSKAASNTDDVTLDTVFTVTSSMSTVIKQPKFVSGPGLETAVSAISDLTQPLDNLVSQSTQSLSDTRVNEIVSSVLSCVDNMFGAALPEVPVLAEDVSLQAVREQMESENSYLNSQSLTEGEDAKEGADLFDNERAFFMAKSAEKQQYEAKQKQQLAKSVATPLLKSISTSLDVSAKFLVVGQEPVTFSNPKLSASVKKRRLESLVEEDSETEGIGFNIELKGELEDNPAVVFKSTVFHQNPFVWDEEATSSLLTSKAMLLEFQMEDTGLPAFQNITDVRILQTVSIPNETPIKSTRVTPQYIPLDRDQLLYHKVKLRTVDDALIIFITSYIPRVKYDVYFKVGQYPTATDYHYKTVIPPTVTLGGKNKLKVICPEKTLPAKGDVYVALKPYELELTTRRKRDATPSNATDAGIHGDYEVGMATVGCRTWSGEAWSSDSCTVSPDSTDTNTVCSCEQSMDKTFTIATSFFVPVNKIDFSNVFTKIDLLNNAAVFATIISLLAVYTLLAVWARHKDCSDFLKWGITPLVDNDPRDRYVYIITVSTGMRPGAGTKSRVGLVISGEHEDTGVRQLYDGIREEFPRNSIMNFLLTVPYPLGDLAYVRLWHENSGDGDNASWFPHEITVEDIQMDKRYVFPCDRWLAVDEDDGKIERTLPVSGKDDLVSFGHLFNDNIRTNITDSHLWLSVVMRPKQSHFTRLQRLSCCLSLLFLTMIASAMFYGAQENVVRPAVVSVGSLRFSLQQLYVSIISIVIVTPVNLAIVLLFKKSKPHGDRKSSFLDRVLAKCCPSQFKMRARMAEVMIAQKTYGSKEKMLPHWCFYVAWVLLFLSVALPAFFLFLYSQQWGKTKSEEWLTAFVLSFFESLIVMDPIKVLLLTVFLSMVFRKPKDELGVDKDEVGKTSVGPSLEENGQLGSAGRCKGPLPEEDLRRAQNTRREESTAFGIVKEVTFYSLFLVVMFTIAYSNRDHRSYALKNNIYNMMVKKQSDKRLGLENVSSREHFFRWMKETALPALFQENYYQGTRRHWRERLYFLDLQNYRVGPPRLRQVRVPKRSACNVPSFDVFSCLDGYSIIGEESQDYCLGWENQPCPDRERVDKFSSDAWTFTSSMDIWGLPVWGQFNFYSGGGYISEMGVNYQVSEAMLKEEFDFLWLDRQTRAVSLEFTLYNPNVNLFCYVTLLVEFPETGSALTSAKVQPFRAYQHSGALGAYILFNEIVFLVYLAFASFKLMKCIRKERWQFFKSFWNAMDFLIVCVCYATIVMFVGRKLMVDAAIEKFKKDPEIFVNFQHITTWDDLLVHSMALICFFCNIRMIKILGYNKRISSISSVIMRASRDLTGFSLLFVIMFMGFVLLGYLLFGRELTAYSTILSTAATLFTSMIGKTPFDEMRRTEPVLAQVYFAFFVFFLVFILLTMFMSILNESISGVRREDVADAARHRVLDILLTKFKESFGWFKQPSKSTFGKNEGYGNLPIGAVAAKRQADSKFALQVLAFDIDRPNNPNNADNASVHTTSTTMSNQEAEGGAK